MTEQDLDYFAARLPQEESAASRGGKPRRRAAQRKVALRYRGVVDAYRNLIRSRGDRRAA